MRLALYPITRHQAGLLTWFLAASMALQAAGETPPHYLARVRQVEDGLPGNDVTSVLQTHDGYIWVGTRSGLARFDGAHFTVFDGSNTPEMQSPHVTCLFEAPDGVLWIGHENGELTRYQNGTFEAVPVHADWRGGKIFAIAADRAGDIWLVNQLGELARLKDGRVIPSPPGPVTRLIALARKPKGGFWIQRDSQVAAVEDGQLKPLPLFEDGATNQYVQGIAFSRDGGLWIMVEQHIRKWKNHEWVTDAGLGPWGWSAVHTLIEMHDGLLAGCTVDHGLYLVKPGGPGLHFSRTNGFSTDWVTAVCEDREGDLWAGLGNGGLAVLRPVNATTISPPDQWQGRAILSVAAGADNALWVGTEGAGVYRFADGDWAHFDEQTGLSNRFVWSLTPGPQGNIWAGTWGNGAFRLSGPRFHSVLGFGNMSVGVLHRLRDGSVGVGTSLGLLRYEAGESVWLGRKPELDSPDVRAVTQAPDGTIWFGMSGGGLGYYRQGKLRQFRRHDGLSSDFVQCLHLEADGALWIGTFGGGLNRYGDGHFSVIGKKQGLPSEVICDIQDDEMGFFWISSHGGITRVSKADLNKCADGQLPKVHCLTYGLSDGLPTLECSGGFQPAGCRTTDGRLWFPTTKGLVSMDPKNVHTNRLQPPVLIEEMRVDGHRVTNNPAATVPLRIGPGRHRIEFDYTGLSFVAPERVRFKYRLAGLEPEWVDAGTKRSVTYSYIPPGNYAFHVTACNNDGIWQNAGAQMAFTVSPYFWQTWWFRLVGGIFTALAGGGIVWLDARRRTHRKLERVERQRAVEQERARIAHDIHDDLGSHLTRITMLSESARGEVESSTRVASDINQIYDTACELTRAMDEIVWAVNPKHDTLESLASYLEKLALDFLGIAGIRCRLDFPAQFPDWLLTAEVRHNLFLAYKEALNNVVKHAMASEVRVRIALHSSGFELSVEDNGRGFAVKMRELAVLNEPDHLTERNGLKNMMRRATAIGGRCEIRSAPGKGTTITFTVPIKTEEA